MQHISEFTRDIQQVASNGHGYRGSTAVAQIIANCYSNRSTLAQLDDSHPSMKRAIKAVYIWRDRYEEMRDPENVAPPRAPSLILSGPNGTGKTHIARAILWAQSIVPLGEDGQPIMAQARPAGKWFDAADLMLKLAPVQTEWKTVEFASVGMMIGASPYVIVDDLGGEGTIPFVTGPDQQFERQARWFRFIDFCYANSVPVIITTNLDIQNGELAEWVGRRAWDRLSEMAPQGQMIGLWDVPSWRVKAGGR